MVKLGSNAVQYLLGMLRRLCVQCLLTWRQEEKWPGSEAPPGPAKAAGVPEGGAHFLYLDGRLFGVALVLGQLPQPGGVSGRSFSLSSNRPQGWTERGAVSCPAHIYPHPACEIHTQGSWSGLMAYKCSKFSANPPPFFFLKASGRDRVTALGKGLENVV